jgi:hypothetical protein
MNGKSSTVLLISPHAGDQIALRQMFDAHPEGIILNCTTVLPKSWDEYALVVTRGIPPISNCPVPVHVLPDNPIRIGTVMDMIEGYILKIDDQSDMTYAQYTLLGSSNILMIDDRRIELTQTEKAIIATLMQAGIDGLDRDALLKMVWNYRSDLDTHTLETHIYRLRQKIEQDPTNPHYLCTIPNGYRLS